MRILFLYMFPLWGNGSASYLRALTAELVARGHTVGIVSPDKRKLKGVTHYYVNLPQNGVFLGHPEMPNAKPFADMSSKETGDILLAYMQAGIHAAADFNPEIIHVFHTIFLPPVGRILKLLYGIRIIITTHGSDLHHLALDRRLNGLISDANRYASAITANSTFTKNLYLEMFGEALRRKTKVIPGGVDLEPFKDTEKTQKYMKQIDDKFKLKDKKIVLFTGRIIKNKGIQFLLKAAPYIHGTILIIGDGPERKALEAEVARKKLRNVIFGGYIGDKGFLHAFYERAAVYVSPTVFEGFGLTILEAMAAHTPVIASNKGGIVSIIKNGVNGYLVSSRNTKELAGAINALLDNDELRKRISEEAYKTVVEKYTWQKIADQFESLYKEHAYTTEEYLKVVKEDNNPKVHHVLTSIKRLIEKEKLEI